MTQKTATNKPGFQAFLMLWIGQLVSQVGSTMTGFGVSIWLFEQTGSATALTTAMTAYLLPNILFGPIAGTIVDRFNRKYLLMFADVMAGIDTLVLVLLFASGRLEVWHIFVLNFLTGSFQSLQWPAFSSAVTMMVDKDQYTRISGLQSIGRSLTQILAPVLAAALYAAVGLTGIITIDLVTFAVGVLLLFITKIPQPERTAEGEKSRGSFWQETKYGFTYIWQRPSLLGLQSVFLVLNFVLMLGIATTVPMILARTGNNEATLGTVQAFGAIGGVVGGLLLTAWGGTKHKIHGVLGGMIVSCLAGVVLLGVANGLLLWAAASFFQSSAISVLNGSNQAIWQTKVAPDVQGRVFSVRRLIAQMIMPISTFVAGPLADGVFEPAMQEGGALADTFGWLVGNGAGSGMSLMLVLAGLVGAFVPMMAYTVPAIREVESRLPDHV